MIIIGADYHPGFQQIAFVDTDTGELQERRLEHREDAEKFYRDLAAQELKVQVGILTYTTNPERILNFRLVEQKPTKWRHFFLPPVAQHLPGQPVGSHNKQGQ